MKFYVASRLANADAQRAMVAALTAAGHELTYDWAVHGSVQAEPERWPIVASSEAAGVIAADFVVVILAGGQGTHVELGIAIACAIVLGQQVVVVGADRPQSELGAPYRCIFYDHPKVRLVDALKLTDAGPESRALEDVVADVLNAVAS